MNLNIRFWNFSVGCHKGLDGAQGFASEDAPSSAAYVPVDFRPLAPAAVDHEIPRSAINFERLRYRIRHIE